MTRKKLLFGLKFYLSPGIFALEAKHIIRIKPDLIHVLQDLYRGLFSRMLIEVNFGEEEIKIWSFWIMSFFCDQSELTTGHKLAPTYWNQFH